MPLSSLRFSLAIAFLSICCTYVLCIPHHSSSLIEDSDEEKSGLRLPIGITNPKSHYQRYRRDLYLSGEPFFQWWYFWVRDISSQQHWAFYLHTSSCGKRQKAGSCDEAVYLMAASVSVKDASTWSLYNKFDLSALKASEKVQAVTVGRVASLHASEDGSTIHLSTTVDPAIAWQAEHSPKGLVSANLTLHRHSGWFGQPEFEIPDRLAGVIQWNTYGHLCNVEGIIQIGSGVIHLSRENDNHIAYADMNWGWAFPEEPPASMPHADGKYAWGWFYAHNAAKGMQSSAIAGVGLSYVNKFLESMDGRFANIVAGSTEVSAVSVGVFEPEHKEHFGASSDVTLQRFDVVREDWHNITDAWGQAQIPLTQRVVIETGSHVLQMNFTALPERTNRLLFPFNGEIFSDFETLGALASVKFWHKSSGTVLEEYQTDAGGLEYGYSIKIHTVEPSFL